MQPQSATPKEILKLIKKKKKLSVCSLKSHLQISDMAVRKHLSKLEKARLIESHQVKQPIGRPVTLYTLSDFGESLFPKTYDTMIIDLLHEIKELYGIETIHALFDKREQRMYAEYEKKVSDKADLKDRVKELTQIQFDNGYMAECHEVNKHEMELIEFNCPILQVANKNVEACNHELSLFKKVLKTNSIKRTSCISQGDHCCKYVIVDE